jgi:hypothetical protein
MFPRIKRTAEQLGGDRPEALDVGDDAGAEGRRVSLDGRPALGIGHQPLQGPSLGRRERPGGRLSALQGRSATFDLGPVLPAVLPGRPRYGV